LSRRPTPVEIPTFKYQMGYSSPTKVCGVTTYVHRAATKPGRYKAVLTN